MKDNFMFKYKDIYDQDLLEAFGDYKEKISNIPLIDNNIDIKLIAQILNIEAEGNNAPENRVDIAKQIAKKITIDKNLIYKTATELLMPDALIIDLLNEAIYKLGYYISQTFEEQDQDLIFQYIIQELNVPYEFGIKRIKELDMFEDDNKSTENIKDELDYNIQIKANQYAIEFLTKKIKTLKKRYSNSKDKKYKTLLNNRINNLEKEKEELVKFLEKK